MLIPICTYTKNKKNKQFR